MNPTVPVTHGAATCGIDRSCISRPSLQIVQRLQQAGYEGYLVGGCVRDLVLGLTPKDFDVATNARPEQVRAIFVRARIIGRRFKLVHVRVGWGRGGYEVVEIATYRAGQSERKRGAPRQRTSNTGRLLDDNVYGTLEQDARRRDFTINALYYDPVTETILDYVGAMADVHKRRLGMIGDVRQRFTEDPVRMLRAVRFQARLGLEPEPAIVDGITQYHDLLRDVPPARIFDEVLKLFHYGAAKETWKLLCRFGLAATVFPQTLSAIGDKGGHRVEQLIVAGLTNTDKRFRQDLPVIPAFLYALLLWRSYQQALAQLLSQGIPRNEAHWLAGDKVFRVQARTVTTPWRARGPALDIWELQFALEGMHPGKIARILAHKRYRAAYDFLLLRAAVDEVPQAVADWWTQIQHGGPEQRRKMIAELRHGRSAATKRRQQKNPRPQTPCTDKA